MYYVIAHSLSTLLYPNGNENRCHNWVLSPIIHAVPHLIFLKAMFFNNWYNQLKVLYIAESLHRSSGPFYHE